MVNTKHERARVFADVYYGVVLPRFRVPTSIRRRTQKITTLVVDTDAFTDQTLRLSHVWSPNSSSQSVISDALHALAGHTNDLAQRLRAAIESESPLIQPIDILTESSWFTTTFHHGAEYRHYTVGEIEDVLHRCGMTENEREKVHLEARKLTASGRAVYAVGSATTRTPHLKGTRPFELSGLLVCSMELYGGTELAVEQLREEGYSMVYASRDTSRLVASIAHASLLAPVSILPMHSIAHHIEAGYPLYAELTAPERQRLINSYPPEETLVVRHPLPQFLQLIRATQ